MFPRSCYDADLFLISVGVKEKHSGHKTVFAQIDISAKRGLSAVDDYAKDGGPEVV